MSEDKRSKSICPTCGYHLLARSNDTIFCLNSGCDWHIESKRSKDKEVIPEINNLKKMWQ